MILSHYSENPLKVQNEYHLVGIHLLADFLLSVYFVPGIVLGNISMVMP